MTSGAEAPELAAQLAPDICMLDVLIKGTNGLELAERLEEVLPYGDLA